jgi:hypothetical protein
VREAKAWAIIAIPILGVVGLGWWLATKGSTLGTTLAHANAQKVLLLHVGSEPSGLFMFGPMPDGQTAIR